jgi:hypothetical protein
MKVEFKKKTTEFWEHIQRIALVSLNSVTLCIVLSYLGGNAACMGRVRNLAGKTGRKKTLGRPRNKWEEMVNLKQ